MDAEYTGIRCPGKRPHSVGDNDYEKCGLMLQGVNAATDCDVVVKCKVCKHSFIITNDGSGISVDEVPDGEFIEFSKRQDD